MRTNLHLVLVASTFLATGCAGTASEDGAQGTKASLVTSAAASPSGGGADDGGCGAAPKISPTRYNSVGAGTDASPFQIWNVDQLKDLARDAQGATGNYAFRQCVDIDMTAAGPFTIPLFNGRYKGDAHTISGLNVGASNMGMGFIGVGDGASITNLTFLQPSVTVPANYRAQVGVVAAYMHRSATATEDHPLLLSRVRVTGATVSGSSSSLGTGAVAGWFGSGLASDINVSGGTVSAGKAGGLFGYTHSAIVRNATARQVNVAGNYAGGVAAQVLNTLVERTSVASCSLAGNDYVGGLAGRAEGATFHDDKVTDSPLVGVIFVGGVAGLAQFTAVVSKVTVRGVNQHGIWAGGIFGRTQTKDEVGAFSIDHARIEASSIDAEAVGGLVGSASGDRLDVGSSVVAGATLTSIGAAGGLLGASDVKAARIENSFAGGRLRARFAGGIVGSGDIDGAFLVTRVSIDGSTAGGGMTGSNSGGVPSSGIAFAGAASGTGALGPIAPRAFPWAGDLYYEDSFPCSGACNNAGISAPLSQLLDPSQAPLNTFPFGSGMWAIGPDGYPTIPSAGATW